MALRILPDEIGWQGAGGVAAFDFSISYVSRIVEDTYHTMTEMVTEIWKLATFLK